jgi:hypothetical protein
LPFSQLQNPPLGAQLNRSHPLSRGLVGCWLFNERSGDKAGDSALMNPGVLTNMDPQSDWIGSDLDFDGTDDYVEIGLNPILQPTTPFTLIVRANTTTLSGLAGLFKSAMGGSDNINSGFMFFRVSAELRFYVMAAVNTWRYSTSNINTNQFYSFAGRWDGSNISLFIDGVKVDEDACSSIYWGTPGLGARIGDYYGENWAGRVSYAFLYNRHLSDQEIARIHASPYEMFEEELPLELLYVASPATYRQRVIII